MTIGDGIACAGFAWMVTELIQKFGQLRYLWLLAVLWLFLSTARGGTAPGKSINT